MDYETYKTVNWPFKISQSRRNALTSTSEDTLLGYELYIKIVAGSEPKVVPNMDPERLSHRLLNALMSSLKSGSVRIHSFGTLDSELVERWNVNVTDKKLKNTANLYVSAIAAIVSEAPTIGLSWLPEDHDPLRDIILIEIASYQSYKASEQLTSIQAEISDPNLHLLASETAELNHAAKEKLESIEAYFRNISQTVIDLQDRIAAFDKSLEASETNLDAFKTAAYEALKIDASHKLWSDEAKKHKMAYWCSSIVIAALIGIPIVGIVTEYRQILEILHSLNVSSLEGLPPNIDGAMLTAISISRLTIIALPIALYFWLIKLSVRFNTRSLAMMDDANQRNTMMHTYLNLIEKGAAQTEDRALLLNAIFRPAPGHTSEGIDAPNLADLIQRGSKP
jgi:hypothetical protein